MAIFKCKICGGSLEIDSTQSVATCEYCGTKQTIPKLDNERRANLYDRANHFRRNNDFDKAMGIYENILNEDNTDAEAYWSLVLCRYGIEYVEDPRTRKLVPTVNRAQFTSIFDDEDYKSAIANADGYQREIYEAEATSINEIQKGILAISQKEEPFDVFVCYKETDTSGRRTQDSVLATELYRELTREGFKVFFSRITLEDKLGVAYEPYIFAALHSAKVMVVLGTRPEHFNAVWVKNEWSRFLALIKNGAKKTLIPAYRDMDPYDLPEEFLHLQAQDMSKLGFMQDLTRGIEKIVKSNEPKTSVVKETVVTSPVTTANIAPLLERAFMFLEDGDWTSADEYCEKVLDQNPKNAHAYLGKLMAELHVRKQDKLKDQAEPFDSNKNYEKAVRFAGERLKSTLTGYIDHISTRNENARLTEEYESCIRAMNLAETEADYIALSQRLEEMGEYKDCPELSRKCMEKAEASWKDDIYEVAIAFMEKPALKINKFSTVKYENAIKEFQSISGWRDSDEKIVLCQQKIEELKKQAEADRLEKERLAEIARKEAERIAKRNKKIAIITTPIICAIIAFIIILNTVIIPNGKYNDAIALMEAGNLDEAYSIFTELGDYNDAADKMGDIRLTKTKEQLKGTKVGDYIKFGVYEQDDNTSNGKEDIEWIVLEVKDGRALVISKNALDCKPYNTSYTDVTWETCTLRKWLNNDFINSAFSTNEKEMIPTVTVSADKNPEYSTNPGKATQDQVFLLSITEVNKYFNPNRARQCKPTDHAVANGAWESGGGYCWWWLRSPGYYQFKAAGVFSGGDVYENGHSVNSGDDAVRPALWIDLNS